MQDQIALIMDLESRTLYDTTQLIVRGDWLCCTGTSTPSSDAGTTEHLKFMRITSPTIKLNDGDEYKALLQLRGNDLEI